MLRAPGPEYLHKYLCTHYTPSCITETSFWELKGPITSLNSNNCTLDLLCTQLLYHHYYFLFSLSFLLNIEEKK